jgi:transposase
VQIASIYGVSVSSVRRRLNEYGIPVRTPKERNDKYHLPLAELLNDFKSGYKNDELAKKYGCTNELIATRKYQFKKKGVLNYE